MSHGTIDRIAQAGGWAVVVALVIVVAIDLWQPLSTTVIAMTALAPVLLLAAWPLAAAALASRHWVMSAAALALAAAQLVLFLPTWAPWHSPPPASPAWRLTLFDMNVRYDNDDLAGVAAQIRRDQPGLITLEELSPANYASLRATGVLDQYGWHFVQPNGGSLGFGLWSDVPLTGVTLWQSPLHPQVEATVHPPGGPAFQLLLVHTLAPRGVLQPKVWSQELAAIGARIAQAPRPLLVVGDFNATQNMRQFQKILAHGLTDAAVVNGKGWVATWPHDRAFPAVLRLDHVLFSGGLTVDRYAAGASAGSDHRSVVVEIGSPREAARA